jgi:recombination protein RecT
MSGNNQVTRRPVDQLKNVLSSPSVQEQFKNAMAENSNLFVASLIDLYASDTYLQNCDPALVVMEALKAATLKLPISKSLGFAYIVPYKKQGKQVPQFQLGYKGMVQLAMRSGVYKYINADVVYEGEFKGFCKLTGDLDLTGVRIGDTVIGYFAYIETCNGFRKTMFSSRDDMDRHAKKYSKSADRDGSPWKTEFDAMGVKTMLRMLLGKYGLMTVAMADGMQMDGGFDEAYQSSANVIDLPAMAADMPTQAIDSDTGEIFSGVPPQSFVEAIDSDEPPFSVSA